MSFALHLPKLSLSGAGSVNDAIAQLQGTSFRKAMVITDQNLLRHGLLEKLYAQLDQQHIACVTFADITPNPTASQVRQAAKQYQDEGCDFFIAVGGGSPVDAAKAIRIMASNDGDICDYEGIGKVENPGAFFIAINTTAGTAAEMTCNSVITDEDRKVKMVIISPHQIPDITVNDPELMVALPADITAATGMDALTHAVEAYLSVGAHTITDHSALAAIRLIAEWLPVAVQDGANLEARDQMACAQFMAGMAFNSAGLGLVHALAHQPGATHDLPHGVCNAILLPVICEFNARHNPARFRAVAEALGGKTEYLNDVQAAELAVKRIRNLAHHVNIPAGFHQLGVKDSDIDGWIDKAMDDPCRGGNPRPSTADDIRQLYRLAM